MTYPPGGPGYQPGQQQPEHQGSLNAPTAQIRLPENFPKSESQQQYSQPESSPAPAASSQPETKTDTTADEAKSPLPMILTIAVAALGLIAYLVSFGPIVEVGDYASFSSANIVVPALLAALLAGVGLLPRQKPRHAIVAVLATLGFLLTVGSWLGALSVAGWALIVVVFLGLLQTVAAIGALLLDAGIITPPKPRPKYEQPQYGQYGGPGQYYGQQPHYGQPGPQQHGGYPQYGGQPGYPGAPSTGGFPAVGQPQGPPTPPTGFPTYAQPPASQPQQGGQQQPQQGGQQQPQGQSGEYGSSSAATQQFGSQSPSGPPQS